MNILDPKSELYCQARAIGKTKMQSSVEVGSNNLVFESKRMVKRIRELLTVSAKKTELNITSILKEMEKIGMSNIKSLFDENGDLISIHLLPDHVAASIKKVEVDIITGKVTKIDFWDKNSALSNLARCFDMYSDNTTVNVNIDNSTKVINVDMSPDEAAKLYALTIGK